MSIVEELRNMSFEKAQERAMEMIKGNNNLEELKAIQYGIFSHTENHNNIMSETIVERVCNTKRYLLESNIDINSERGQKIIKQEKINKYKKYLVA